MIVELFGPMPSRPCALCISLQGDSVFADFDVDTDRRLFAVRVSFDGYGCCRLPPDVTRTNAADSAALLAMAERDVFDASAPAILRSYFREIRDVLWEDALAHHDLI